MSDIFEKKSVYHSALVKASPITITLTCDAPQESKFSKPNAPKPPFISFKHDGSEHFLEVENDECGEALSGLKGQTVTIEATGSRGEARIEILEGGGSQRQQQQPPPRKAASSPAAGAAKPRTPEDREAEELKAFKRMKVLGARVAVAMQSSFKFAKMILDKEMPGAGTEDLRALAICHFIEVKSTTDLHGLPTHWIETAAAPKQPERKPEPPPAAADDADLDDIPF